MLIGIFQHGHRFQYQRRLEKSHRRRSKTFCIQCTAQQAQENECTDQRALVVSATIYHTQNSNQYQQIPSTTSWKISIYSLVKSAVSFRSWIVTQTVELLFCRETAKCFVQVILLLRLNINKTNFKYYKAHTISIKSFTV